jgi:ABC-type transport system substrate-binding protein
LYALSNAFYIVSTGPNKYASIDSDQVARLEANPPSGFKVDGGAGAEDAVGTWSISTTGVPEPSIMLLLGMGLVGLFGLTLRKSA